MWRYETLSRLIRCPKQNSLASNCDFIKSNYHEIGALTSEIIPKKNFIAWSLDRIIANFILALGVLPFMLASPDFSASL